MKKYTWIYVLGCVVVVIKLLNAVMLRFNLKVFAEMMKTDLTYPLQSFADRASARDAAIALVLGFSLFKKHTHITAWLFILVCIGELQDFLTLTADLVKGNIDMNVAVSGIPSLILITLMMFAALRLLNDTSNTSSSSK
jgi:hypothetical protein